jgi:hypothetical protein
MLCRLTGGELDQTQFLLGHVSMHLDAYDRALPRVQTEVSRRSKRQLVHRAGGCLTAAVILDRRIGCPLATCRELVFEKNSQ